MTKYYYNSLNTFPTIYIFSANRHSGFSLFNTGKRGLNWAPHEMKPYDGFARVTRKFAEKHVGRKNLRSNINN